MAAPQQPRILIVRLSAIGDVIHGLPVACALRRQFPGAYLAWIVEGRAGDLLEGHPALDRVVRVPRGWLKSPPTVWRLRRELRNLRFDVALDLQGLTKSAIAAWISGAGRRIGLAGRDGRELSTWLNKERVAPTATHVIDRNLELLRPLGIERPAVEFNLPERPEEAARADEQLAALGLREEFAVLNPGAGWASKRWPPERFAEVARHLGDECGLPTVVVWAGAEEKTWGQEIVAGSGGHARLAPSTTLRELAAINRRARLFVGADTGPLHLAVAVGTPSVGLFGPMPHERNGPYGEAHLALQEARLHGTSRQRRQANNDTMRAIGDEQVCHACETLLARRPPAKPQAA